MHPTTRMLDSIEAAYRSRLADISRMEQRERQMALATYRTELRKMYRAAPSGNTFDRHVRRVTRPTIRYAYTQAIDSALLRADTRHQAADKVRRTMRAVVSGVSVGAVPHLSTCGVAVERFAVPTWLDCTCGAARRVSIGMAER